MSEWLTPQFISALTPAGLLSIFVLMLFLGRLRPKSAVDEVRQDRDERIADAHEQITIWREAYRLSESAREKNEAALREALEVARAAEDALKGFRAAMIGRGPEPT